MIRNTATTGKRMGIGWLYNWYTTTNKFGIAPDGWRVFSSPEWYEMINYLIDNYEHISYDNAGGALKAASNEWRSPNYGATDEFKFNFNSAGVRLRGELWSSPRFYGALCTSTESSLTECRIIMFHSTSQYFTAYPYIKTLGSGIRCIQNKASGEQDGDTGTLTDCNGNIYPWVVIGNYRWMAENLRATHYKWSLYGTLYNWYAVNNADELVSSTSEWRIPTRQEWIDLFTYVNNNVSPIETGAVNHLKSRRQVSSPLGGIYSTNVHPRWDSDTTLYGRDTIGFEAYPGGFRDHLGVYSLVGQSGYWWSITDSGDSARRIRLLSNSNSYGDSLANKKAAFSVRLIRNATTQEQAYSDGTQLSDYTGNDGTKYKTIKIGTRAWTAENLRETKYVDGSVIPLLIENSDWANDTQGARCTYPIEGNIIPEVTLSSEWDVQEEGARCAYNNDHYYVYPPLKQ